MASPTTTARAAPPKTRPRRSAWWVVHHWAGLKLGLLLSFILLTGTIATISNEIDWLMQPAMRAMPQDRPMASWGAWYAAAASRPGFTVGEVSAPIGSGFAVRATGADADGTARLIHINPWTAKVQGVGSTTTVQDVVRDVHRKLILPGKFGLLLVTSLSIPLFLTLVTAFKVYKKWWRGFLRWPRRMRDRKRELRRYIGDLHRLGGLWSLWFIALMSLSGLWYFVERLGAELPEIEGQEVATAPILNQARIDAMVEATARQWPEYTVRHIAIDGGRITLSGQAHATLVRDRSNKAWFNGTNGTSTGTHDAEKMTPFQRLSEAVDPLHFGNWGGLASKLFWFLFGLLLSGLSVSGTLICALRLVGPGERLRAVSKEMGLFGVVSAGLVVLVLAKLLITLR